VGGVVDLGVGDDHEVDVVNAGDDGGVRPSDLECRVDDTGDDGVDGETLTRSRCCGHAQRIVHLRRRTGPRDSGDGDEQHDGERNEQTKELLHGTLPPFLLYGVRWCPFHGEKDDGCILADFKEESRGVGIS